MLGLALADGDHVVVYDAEDRPGPGQLREAAETFAAADERLGCLQAPLTIVDAPGLLSRFFAAEYEALFRVLLPALACWSWPLPLGGTSNHFRRSALVAAGGWDPYNVTEDADLGFRLARHGFATGTITTPTREEPPATLAGWLGQRARWFKGWMQTLAVLARRPLRLRRELGLGGCLPSARRWPDRCSPRWSISSRLWRWRPAGQSRDRRPGSVQRPSSLPRAMAGASSF